MRPSVRVGSGYGVEYYFIYFPVVVQNTGKGVVLQVDGRVEVCRVTISRYLKQCASKSRLCL